MYDQRTDVKNRQVPERNVADTRSARTEEKNKGRTWRTATKEEEGREETYAEEALIIYTSNPCRNLQKKVDCPSNQR